MTHPLTSSVVLCASRGVSSLTEILIIRVAGADGEAREKYSVDPSRLVPSGETRASQSPAEVSQ